MKNFLRKIDWIYSHGVLIGMIYVLIGIITDLISMTSVLIGIIADLISINRTLIRIN